MIVMGIVALSGQGTSCKTVDMLVWVMPPNGSAELEAGIVTVAGGGQLIDPLEMLLGPQAMVERLET